MTLMWRFKSNIIVAFSALIMSMAVTSCHSHKKNSKDELKKYEQIYVDDIYDGNARKQSKLYKEIKSWLGVPYKYAGHSKNGTDCSGLVMEVYKNVYGKKIVHYSADIYDKYCRKINRSQLKEGDLVFFSFVKSRKISHVGIYLLNNKFIHSSSSKGVIISDLDEPYYIKNFVGCGRVK